MIERFQPHTDRRRIGLLTVGSLALACALSVQAQVPAADQAAQNLPDRTNPRYPKDSIADKEQGTVVLQIKVGADGLPRSAILDTEHTTTRSALLIASATDAAMKWRFKPATKNGVPVESYVRIPVNFSINEGAQPDHGKAAAKPHQA